MAVGPSAAERTPSLSPAPASRSAPRRPRTPPSRRSAGQSSAGRSPDFVRCAVVIKGSNRKRVALYLSARLLTLLATRGSGTLLALRSVLDALGHFSECVSNLLRLLQTCFGSRTAERERRSARALRTPLSPRAQSVLDSVQSASIRNTRNQT